MIPNSKPFAWQGISLKIPQDWDLGAIEGDYKEGYFRLDDSEDVRLEVKWRREKHKTSLEKVLENYLSTLQAQAKKKKLTFLPVKPREELTKVYLKDKEFKFFSWKTDSLDGSSTLGVGEIFGFVSQCNRCHTIVMAQISLKEKDATLIPEILKTLEDHSLSNSIQWAVYDFIFFLPDDFRIEKCSLRSGYLEFVFSTNSAEIKIRRWGLANMLLEGRTLEQWAKEIAPKIFKNKINSSVEEENHKIIHLNLRRWKWHSFYVRHCKFINKIYALDYTGKRDEELFNKIYSKIKCH